MNEIRRSIDLRSDTVTRPTPAMRRAIAEAEVGDDVFGDDPTVRALEERVAVLLGKEAGLFVTSGTMGNQIAVAVHTRPGDEVLLEEQEPRLPLRGGGARRDLRRAGPHAPRRARPDRRPRRSAIALRPRDVHFSDTRFSSSRTRTTVPAGACCRSTGWRDGRARPRDRGSASTSTARASGMPRSPRGSRRSDTRPAAIPSPSASRRGSERPVGSVLCGTAEFVERARHVRKRLGGGMRQAGILAAACLHALDHHRERLADDHRVRGSWRIPLPGSTSSRSIPPPSRRTSS